MRLVLCDRPSAAGKEGGDTRKSALIAEEAVKRGWSVSTVNRPADVALSGADVAQLFNLDEPEQLVAYAFACERHGIPYVVSTIMHPQLWLDRYTREADSDRFNSLASTLRISPTMSRRIRSSLRTVKHGGLLEGSRSWTAARDRQSVLSGAAAVVAMSPSESDRLLSAFGVRALVIPNGHDPVSRSAELNATHAPNRVVCVGRIEPRKNQLGLLRSFIDSGLDTPLLFVGALNSNHAAYAECFLDLVQRTEQANYIGQVTPLEVSEIVAGSAVAVSASWFEVVSQVEVQAIASGVPIVTAPGSDIGDYLTQIVPTIDPARIAISDGRHLETAISRALSTQKARLKPDYDLPWTEVAQAYVALYQGFLSDR